MVTNKKKQKYRIYFVRADRRLKFMRKRKTNLYMVRKDSKTGLAELLGLISWNSGWRRYVFRPEQDYYFDGDCLKQISEFLIQITYSHTLKGGVSK